MNSLSRLEQQIQFIVEIDKLKQVFRQTWLCDRSRKENDAEHSWHLAVMALLLNEYANDPKLDLLKVMKMLLIHDIVEIDAGDVFFYDSAAAQEKRQREEQAAQRLFGLLPLDQATQLHDLWEEFEQQKTSEAQFAAALDRMHPMLQNFYSDGASWRAFRITKQQVLARNQHIAQGSQILWKFVENMINQAAAAGMLIDTDEDSQGGKL